VIAIGYFRRRMIVGEMEKESKRQNDHVVKY